jgi:hypothetical protein
MGFFFIGKGFFACVRTGGQATAGGMMVDDNG